MYCFVASIFKKEYTGLRFGGKTRDKKGKISSSEILRVLHFCLLLFLSFMYDVNSSHFASMSLECQETISFITRCFVGEKKTPARFNICTHKHFA